MAILEKIAGWRDFYREPETAILITNNQHEKGVFYSRKTGYLEQLRRFLG